MSSAESCTLLGILDDGCDGLSGLARQPLGGGDLVIGARLVDAKIRLAEAEDEIINKTRAAARATDEYVHDNPWQAVGVAAAIGVLVGLIVGRRY